MKYVRWFMVIIVVLYAAWIAFPVVKAFLFPVDMGRTVPSFNADSGDYSGGMASDMHDTAGAVMADSIQGDTAVEAIQTSNTPVIVLWGAVVMLYVTAALLHANGNIRSAIVYGLGFVGDLILTYLTNGNKGGGLYDKILDILSGWDPRYVLTLVALVLGFLIYMSRQKRPSRADV